MTMAAPTAALLHSFPPFRMIKGLMLQFKLISILVPNFSFTLLNDIPTQPDRSQG